MIKSSLNKFFILIILSFALASCGGSSDSENPVDNTAPDEPTLGASATNNASPAITGIAEAGSSVTVEIGGATYTLTADGTGAWSLDTATATPGSGTFTPLTTGDNGITITSTDAAGNATSITATITLDTVAPVAPALAAPATNSDSPTITGTAEAGSSVTVEIGGAIYTLIADGTGAWTLDTATTTPDSGSFTPLATGDNTITITSTDAAGNASSSTVTLTLDATPPDTPTVNSQTTSDITPTITGSFDSTDAAGGFSVAVNGVTYTLGDGNLTNTANTWRLSIPVANAISIDGSYDVTASITDAVGNVSNDGSASELTINTAGFGINLMPITTVAENAAYTGATPIISGVAIGTLTYALTGADAADFTIDTATGVVSMVARDFEAPADAGADNVYNLGIVATDADANTASMAWTVTVTDVTEAATFTIDAIADTTVAENAAFTGTTPGITGDTPIGTLVYTLGGTDAADFSIDGATGLITMVARDFEAAADGNTDNAYEVTIIATDSDGNTASEAQIVTVTDVLPATLALAFDPIKTFNFTWTDVTDTSTTYNLMENTGSGFVPVVSDIAYGEQSLKHIVPLYARVNASYILESCTTGGCEDSNIINIADTMANSIGYFKASNTDASNTGEGDRFGGSISFSADGSTMAVGAYWEGSATKGINTIPDELAAKSGAVHVFVSDGAGGWSHQAYIKASNTDAGDEFGWSVSLSTDGNTLAVGARDEDSEADGVGAGQGDNAAGNAGAVYVFTRSGTSWTQQEYIKANNSNTLDQFGQSVSLRSDGNTLAVGSRFEDTAAAGSGAVYMFSRSGTTWAQSQFLKASNSGLNDEFGQIVSISADGTILAVGAYREDSGTTGVATDATGADELATDAGAVYVFNYDGATWSQHSYIKASNPGANDRFGLALNLSRDGNTLAVGAYREDGSTADIGGTDDNAAVDSGAVYVFSRDTGTDVWSQQAYVKASNTGAGDEFGRAVSLSENGDVLAVGAHWEDGGAAGVNTTADETTAVEAGAVYTYTRETGTVNWTSQTYVKASNTEAGDEFGWAVSLTADGNTLAVGAKFEASNATGVGSTQTDNSTSEAGAVYLY